MRLWIVAAVVLLVNSAPAQFRSATAPSSTGVSSSVLRNSDGLLFGWLDPARLSMHHSYTLSYSSFGGQGLSMGMYTNSLAYKFSDPLDVRFDVSVLHTPFGAPAGMANIGGIYLTRAELNYRPSEHTWLQIQFRQLPPMYWWNSGYGLYDRILPTDVEDR